MSELTTVLGFEAAQAIRTLSAMETALNKYTAAMRASASATSNFNRTGGNVERTLAKVTDSARITNKATKDVGVAQGQAEKAVKKYTKTVETSAKKQEEAAKRVLLSWQSVVRIFAIQVIHQIVTKITTSMWEGVTAARAYEISLAEIQTIGREFRKDFEGLSDQVREFSDELGAPIESVAEGVYQTLSNQVTDAGHAFEFMAASQAFAIAAVTETQSAVALLSSVMNSYNISIDQSAKVGGKLAKIIELGRLRGEEFANTFGRLTVLASQLGISLDEVGATLATLTVSGLKYNEASTLMLNIMLKLIRPTEELKKRYDELGISGAEAGIQAYGFQGFLDKISESAGTSVTALGNLFNRVRAIRGVMGLANENAEKYVKNLEGIREAGAAELFEKRDIIFETNAKQVEIELNKLRNTMVVGFGRSMNDMLRVTFDTFGGGVEIIQAIGVASLSAAAGLVYLKVSALAAAGSLTVVSTAFVPFAIVAGIAVAAGALFAFFNKAEADAIKLRKTFEEQSELALKTHLKNIDLEIEAQKKRDKEIFSNIQKHLFERQKAFDIASKDLIKLEDLVFGSIVDQLGEKISATNTFFSNLEEKATTADTVIKKLNQTIQLVQFDISDFNFERETRGLDSVEKAFVSIERSAKLRRTALEAARQGEIEVANLYNKRARAAANIALQSADESKNRKVIAAAEKEVRATYASQIAIIKKKKILVTHEKKEVESVAKQIFLQRQELEFLNDEIESTIEEFEKVRFDPVKREEVLAKIRGLADEMETIFSDIKIEFKLPEAVDMRSMITGEEEAMSKVIAGSLAAISKRAIAMVTPETAVDVKLAERFPGAETPEEQSAALLKYTEIKNKAMEAEKDHAIAVREISAALNKNREILKDVAKAYEEATAVSGLDLIRIKLGIDTTSMKDMERASEASAEAMDLTTEAVRLLNAEELDVSAFNAVKNSLANMAKEISDPEVIASLGALIDNLNLIAEARQKLIGADTILSREELIESQNDLERINELLSIEMSKSATAGATSVAKNMENTRIAIASTINSVKALNAELGKGVISISPEMKRFGGPLYRADGGFIPRGADTIPTMLTPGEFVMNAGASRKFYSQLMAMNSGISPQYRQSGGPVTNVGDVNITVNESTSAQQTARETMQAFRREMRRGTSRL